MPTPYFDQANSIWKIKVKGDDGKWRAKSLCKGAKSDPPPPEVLALAAPYMGPPSPPEATGSGPTLQTYFGLYQRRYDKRPASKRRLAYTIRHFTGFASQNAIQTIAQVGIKEVNAYIDHRRAAGTMDSTIQAELALLQGIWKMAVEEGHAATNPVKSPAARVRKAIANAKADSEDPELSEEIKYYTKEQQERIIKALDLFAKPKYRDIAIVMLRTGMRVDAALNMDFSWITEDNYIRIPRRWDKGKRGYTTYLFGDDAKAIIARRREAFGSGRVFPDISDDRLVYHQLQALYTSVRAGASLADVAEKGAFCHAFRHTFAVTLVERGIDLPTIQKFMGHASIKVTQRYAKVTDDHLRSVVARIEGVVSPAPMLTVVA